MDIIVYGDGYSNSLGYEYGCGDYGNDVYGDIHGFGWGYGYQFCKGDGYGEGNGAFSGRGTREGIIKLK